MNGNRYAYLVAGPNNTNPFNNGAVANLSEFVTGKWRVDWQKVYRVPKPSAARMV
jgi:hypothetical protein